MKSVIDEKIKQSKQLTIFRELEKLIKRKIMGFKEELTVYELKKNPFTITMIQTALSNGEISKQENELIRKVIRAIYSFVDGKDIDKILPEAFKEIKANPIEIEDIVKDLYELSNNVKADTTEEYKIYLITFAYMVAMEDCKLEEKEDYLFKLIDKLNLPDKEVNRIIESVKEDFGPEGKGRTGNIFRNVLNSEMKRWKDFFHKNH